MAEELGWGSEAQRRKQATGGRQAGAALGTEEMVSSSSSLCEV